MSERKIHELPDEFIDPIDEDPAVLQSEHTRNANLKAALMNGTLDVPPCVINGEDLVIFEYGGGELHFRASRIVEKVIALIRQGADEITIDTPFLTANVIGNMLVEGKFYFVEECWKNIMMALPQHILGKCGAQIECGVAVLGTPPDAILQANVKVIHGLQ